MRNKLRRVRPTVRLSVQAEEPVQEPAPKPKKRKPRKRKKQEVEYGDK